MILLAFAVFVFWLWALVDALMQTSFERGDRILWVLVIVFLFVLGAILYVVFGRERDARPATRRPRSVHPSQPPRTTPRGPDDDPDFLRSLG